MTNFNPRFHERSDVKEGEILLVIDISIHASTRGATEHTCCRNCELSFISIHASTRGATSKTNVTYRYLRFQSTLPREERRLLSFSKFDRASISIHASTRGATVISQYLITTYKFQSTLPREERRQTSGSCLLITHFNPRFHERSDKKAILQREKQAISIHASTRGATAILHKKFVYFYTIPTINI